MGRRNEDVERPVTGDLADTQRENIEPEGEPAGREAAAEAPKGSIEQEGERAARRENDPVE